MRSLIDDVLAAAAGTALAPAERALREAVVSHLRDLLATPRGSVLLAPEYGLEEPTRLFHEHPGSAADMERDLLELVMKFEPRLINVSVHHFASDELELLLRFDIKGTLMNEGRAHSVHFSTVIDSQHHVDLK